ncbi:MAG: AraC family transcriptional regulator [Leptospirales bacterium]|jgi:AraC-like DNA-binding protein
MDLLSKLLTHADWKNDLLWSAAMHCDWGFHFPCERSGGFHIITRGRCYARFGQAAPLPLEKGDVLFVLQGVHHDLVSTPRGRAVDVSRLGAAGAKSQPGSPASVVTGLVSVRYEIPDGPRHPFFQELPERILVRAADIPVAHPIHTTIAMIAGEIESGAASELVVQRLSDVLLYYVLRRWLEIHPGPPSGWVAVFRDQLVLRVLENIHRDLLQAWTVETLAGSVGVSRASLAARFKRALGLTVMDYILRLRLERGRDRLAASDETLEEISRAVGYSSAFAFSKAYKRVYGEAPQNTRRNNRKPA